MGERMDKRIRFYIYWILGFVLLGACAPGDKEDVYTEMRAFEDFSHINGDSVAIVPRKVRLKAFQKMEEPLCTRPLTRTALSADGEIPASSARYVKAAIRSGSTISSSTSSALSPNDTIRCGLCSKSSLVLVASTTL